MAVEDEETIAERKNLGIDEVVVDMFNSLVPENIVDALASAELLSVLVASATFYQAQSPTSSNWQKKWNALEELCQRLQQVADASTAIGHYYRSLFDQIGACSHLLSHSSQHHASRYPRSWREHWDSDRGNALQYVHTPLHVSASVLFHLHQDESLRVLVPLLSLLGYRMGHRL